MSSLAIVVLFLGALQLPPPPPPPPAPNAVPRDAARDATALKGTAIIRGRVVQQDTGEPVARAIVRVTPVNRMRPDDMLSTRTGADGRYEFKELAAGQYYVTADPGEFRATLLVQNFGETRPPSARPRPPRPLTLNDGEVKEANLTLWRAFAVEGRVVDEFGEPMSGVSVMAKDADSGQPTGTRGPYQFVSDDRGMYRVFGLAPGRYTICAAPRNFGMPRTDDIRERPIQTCYPAAVVDSDAQPVVVGTADVGGIDIRIQRSRAFTVSGFAVDSSGAPLERAQLNLIRLERNSSSGVGIELRPGGQFIARGVVPGEYAIQAEIGRPFNQDDKREREIAHVLIRVENADIEGLVVATSKTARVAGRVVFEEDAPAGDSSNMRVSVMHENMQRMSMGPQPWASVNTDLTFELTGLFGPSIVMLSGAPRGWVVNSVRYQGEDITDRPVTFGAARQGDVLEIKLTSHGARVSGRVTDERGGAASEARVLLLPVDPARWKSPNAAAGSAMLKPDGTFQIGPVRAAEYLIAAINVDDFPKMMPEESFYERVAKAAERITLAENEQRAIELRLQRLQ